MKTRWGLVIITGLALGVGGCSDDVWESSPPPQWQFSWPPAPAHYGDSELLTYKDNSSGAEVTVLKLKGDAVTAARAHGYLLGPYIVHMIENVLIPAFGEDYAAVHEAVLTAWDWNPGYGVELDALREGIKERAAATGQHEGWNLELEALGRQLDTEDLMVWNTYFDGVAPYGETFAAWGEMAEGKELFLGRNYYISKDDPGYELARSWMVVTYDGLGNNKVMTVAPPGFIGVTTGINDATVLLAPVRSLDQVAASGRGTPLGLILREHLLKMRPPENPDNDLETRLRGRMKFGKWNVLGGWAPAYASQWPKAGYVVETDAGGTYVRYAHDPTIWPAELACALFVGDRHRIGKGPVYNGDDDLYRRLVIIWSGKFAAQEYMGEANSKAVLADFAGGANAGNCYSVVLRGGHDGIRVYVAVSDGGGPAGTQPFAKLDPAALW